MAAAQQAQAKAPIVPEADGFVVLPKAAVQIDKRHVYRAIWNATSDADGPKELVPALNMLGSELNAFAVSGVPLSNAKFLIVFHGPSVNGLYDDANYKAKFGVPNPNLKVLSELRKAGVEIYVCGQFLLGEKIDPSTLSPDVTVAVDALIVLMDCQNKAYALMSF